MTDFIAGFYGSYLDIKSNWQGVPDPDFAAYYDKLFSKLTIPGSAHVLELGFGDGQFLRWCLSKGYTVAGVEIIPDLVQRAKELGIECFTGPLHDRDLGDARFDAIVAFDVLEHMSIAGINDFLKMSKSHLAPGGFVLARFPNSASPFGAMHQYSDVTHLSNLSAGVIEQIATRVGFRVDSFQRPRVIPKFPKSLRRRVAFLAQDFIEAVVKLAYFGGSARLEPNIVAVLRAVDRP